MRATLTACAILLLTCVTSAAGAEPRIASERFDDWFYRCVGSEKEKDKKPARCEAVQIAQTKEGDKDINLLTISLSEVTQKKKERSNHAVQRRTPVWSGARCSVPRNSA